VAEHSKPPPADQQPDRDEDQSCRQPLDQRPLRGQDATLERLRVDRRLEEALTHGPDTLHLALALVFGIDENTAIRYAVSARVLLDEAAEQPSQ
jgi:hypothetical protein